MTVLQQEIGERFELLSAKILAARALSPDSHRNVRLVAVSKRQPLERVKALFSSLGYKSANLVLGENYVQEWSEKRGDLPTPREVHLIGPLQSNKARDAVALFDVIESVHSEKILSAIAKEAGRIGSVKRIFLQVNISEDPAKAGFAPEGMKAILEKAKTLTGVKVEGLMTITKDYLQAEEARPDFRALRVLRDSLDPTLELSMGMSSDFEVAIQEGATLVRIGSALFGSRE